jgi:hypothetical protein
MLEDSYFAELVAARRAELMRLARRPRRLSPAERAAGETLPDTRHPLERLELKSLEHGFNLGGQPAD